MSDTVKVGLIGSDLCRNCMPIRFKITSPNADIIAVASLTEGKAAEFAKEKGIPNAFQDYRELLKLDEMDVASLGVPNVFHFRLNVFILIPVIFCVVIF